MRELIFLLSLLCFSECSTTMTSIMDYYGDADSAIAFYYREACTEPIDFTSTYMLPNTGSSNWANFRCDDTIGFLPLRDDKVQIFVSASKKDESGNEYDTLKISVMYRAPGTVGTDPYDTIFTCDIQGESVIDPTLTGRSDVEKTDEKLDVSGASQATDPVTCSGIKMDMAKLAGFWKLEKIMEISGTQSPKVYFETAEVTAIDVQKLTDNVRCDPSKLTIASSKTTTDKVYTDAQLEKTLGAADKLKLLANGVKVPLEGTTVIPKGGICEAGFEFIYKVNGGEEKVARKVECKKHTLNGVDGKWKYMVVPPQLQTKDPAGNPILTPQDSVVVDPKDDVEVACMQMKCRTCTDPNMDTANPVKCMFDTVCPVVQHNETKKDENDITTCYSLTTHTCTDGVILLNGKYQKFAPVQKTMCVDGTYTVNNQKVISIACADKFSPQGSLVNTMTEPTKLTEPVVSAPAVDCHNVTAGCICRNPKGLRQLAIVSNDGTKFLRVESVKFDQKTGDWFYVRKMGNETRTFKLDANRTVRCISFYHGLPWPKDLPYSAKSVV